MNTKKILGVILAAVMLVTASLGLAACSKEAADLSGSSSTGAGSGTTGGSGTTYTITFNANGGTLDGDTKQLKTNSSGKLVGTVPTATKEGFKFDGWSTSKADPEKKITFATYQFTKSTTVYAIFKSGDGATAEYTITFDYGSDAVGTKPANGAANAKTTAGKLASLPANPTIVDTTKEFDGWYDAATAGNKVTTETVFSKDGTIYARYKEKSAGSEYTITLQANGGTIGSTTLTTSGKKIAGLAGVTVTPPTNKKLKGWYDAATGGNLVKDGDDVTADKTIYAQYEDNSSAASSKCWLGYTANNQSHWKDPGATTTDAGKSMTEVTPTDNAKKQFECEIDFGQGDKFKVIYKTDKDNYINNIHGDQETESYKKVDDIVIKKAGKYKIILQVWNDAGTDCSIKIVPVSITP